MRTLIFALIVLLSFSGGMLAQGKKTLKSQAEVHQTDSEKIEFTAQTVIPMSMPIKDVSADSYTLTLSPDFVKSELPYIGVAHSGSGLGRDKGMRFKGAPEHYEVIQEKDNTIIKATVKTDKDRFDIVLTASASKYATLTISSRTRETITYRGMIK